MKLCILALFLFFSTLLFAQVKTAGEEREKIPPPNVREADVTFSKRVWRIIDLREKQNRPAGWPAAPLNRILYNAILAGRLVPYRSDSLKASYSISEFKNLGSKTHLIKNLTNPNDDDGLYTVDTVHEPFDPFLGIRQIMVMEDWYYDRKLSTLIPRIIAIAPLYHLEVEGYDAGLQTLCWLRYLDPANRETDCRDVLVKSVMFNKENSRSTFTFDDWFEQRLFGSFIIKESNMYDISILQDPIVNKNGLEALIEAERIKRDQYKQEADMYED